ncbi:MAG: hypothetical protein GX442_08635 [Candidatus Riflebacteria bacterium]|nr:hypothetical protein [Candidatus Riflebacteria bacterium]
MKKNEHALEDYGLEVDFLDTALHRLVGHPNRHPWRASLRNWPITLPLETDLSPGFGDTREEAIANLRRQFAEFAASHDDLPDPHEEPPDPDAWFPSVKGYEAEFRLFVKILEGNFIERWAGGGEKIPSLFPDESREQALDTIARVWGVPPDQARGMQLGSFLHHIRTRFPWHLTAFVGVFWLGPAGVMGSLFHLPDSYVYGKFLGPARSFAEAWERLREGNPYLDWKDERRLPRGRVLYDFQKHSFVLVAEAPELLARPAVTMIRTAFGIPADGNVQQSTDPFFGPFPTDFPVEPTPEACSRGVCDGARPAAGLLIIEKPHSFFGWSRYARARTAQGTARWLEIVPT